MGLISSVSSRTYRKIYASITQSDMADENIGPLPPSAMGLGNMPSTDLKVKNLDADDAQQFADVREKFALRQEAAEGASSVRPTERQEWMMGPGNSKITAATAMKNRGFQQVSGSKEGDERRTSDPDKLAILQQESAKLQSELELYNQKHNRCESMLDR